MKNRIWWLSFATFFMVSGCSTDFQLEGEWKDIPIVYGILSLQDTAHYIRVEKAFLEPGGNAEEIAQIADSLYYDNATVQLQVGGGSTYTLERVDGNLEGYPREDGPFASSPNYLYKIRKSQIPIAPGSEVQLIINRGDNLEPVTAETTVIGSIVPNDASPASPMNWAYNRFVNIAWNVEEAAKIFDVRMIVNYSENSAENPTEFEARSEEFILETELIRGDQPTTRVSINVQGESFYQLIGSRIPPAVNQFRILDGIDFKITAGGQEFIDLIEIARVNAGITSSQVVPVYSNISEGLGIFTSRSVAFRKTLRLDAPSLDSLKNGIYTEQLNFVQ